jgi:hypothetical protein
VSSVSWILSRPSLRAVPFLLSWTILLMKQEWKSRKLPSQDLALPSFHIQQLLLNSNGSHRLKKLSSRLLCEQLLLGIYIFNAYLIERTLMICCIFAHGRCSSPVRTQTQNAHSPSPRSRSTLDLDDPLINQLQLTHLSILLESHVMLTDANVVGWMGENLTFFPACP